MADIVTDKWNQRVHDEYICALIVKAGHNPDMRVRIHYNDDAGTWQYSVVLCSNGTWLDSFPTQCEAEKFITDNNLQEQ